MMDCIDEIVINVHKLPDVWKLVRFVCSEGVLC